MAHSHYFLSIEDRNAWLGFDKCSSASQHNSTISFVFDLDEISEQYNDVIVESYHVALAHDVSRSQTVISISYRLNLQHKTTSQQLIGTGFFLLLETQIPCPVAYAAGGAGVAVSS